MNKQKKPMRPWRAHMPGLFKSTKNHEQKIIPSHARPIK